MKVDVYKSGKIEKYVVNNYVPLLEYDSEINYEQGEGNEEFLFRESEGFSYFLKNLDIKERIVGMGEKAKRLIKNREHLIFYNYDQGGYKRDDDPLYVSIPFFISISDNITGYFINSPTRIEIDTGLIEYDKIQVKVADSGFELFVIHGNSIEDIVKEYTKITGRTFVPPKWALGHQISRYSYYPDETVLKIVKEYKKFIDVSAVYLDIDYMEKYKIFTFDNERFPDPRKFKKTLNDMDTKLITIIDPGFKLDQNYPEFVRGLGNYVINSNDEIYTSKLWPGNSAFLNFIDSKSYNYWKECVKSFAENVDGLWLDMNEPALFNDERTIAHDAIHYGDGGFIEHSKIHNLYSLLEVRATYEALNEVKKDVFILSRSGYPGIQRYAAIWTGDNKGSEDDLRLQISMIASMNISGVMVCGCDLGGFFGWSSPDLISKYYRMAMLFPFYRNHKVKEGNDQEIFQLPEKYKKQIQKTVEERYRFIDYMYSLIHESSIDGTPIIRPLFYIDPYDDTSYYTDDEYMLGDVLYAPDISSDDVYLPEGKWLDLTTFKEYEGHSYLKRNDFSLYMRKNSAIIYDGNIIVYGTGNFKLFQNDWVYIEADEQTVKFSADVNRVIIPSHRDLDVEGKNIKYDRKENYDLISGIISQIKL
jgi:alpha-glucosidase